MLICSSNLVDAQWRSSGGMGTEVGTDLARKTYVAPVAYQCATPRIAPKAKMSADPVTR